MVVIQFTSHDIVVIIDPVATGFSKFLRTRIITKIIIIEYETVYLFRQNTYLQNKKHTLTCQVGLVVTDLITSPVVSWEGWEIPPPQHRGSAVILCSTTGVVRPLCSCGDLLLSSARHCLRLVDVDWNTFSLWMSIFLSFFSFI